MTRLREWTLEAENIRLGNENRVLRGDRDALRTEKAGAMSALGMARSENTALKNRVTELELERAQIDSLLTQMLEGRIYGISAKKEAPR